MPQSVSYLSFNGCAEAERVVTALAEGDKVSMPMQPPFGRKLGHVDGPVWYAVHCQRRNDSRVI